jgi:hypothetical protein
MTRYDSKNGLEILKYLGITIDKEESRLFEKYWKDTYERTGGRIVGTVWQLYTIIIPNHGTKRTQTSIIRDHLFTERNEQSQLGQKLRNGERLEDILKSPFLILGNN